MNNIVWKDIPGYEGLYQINNYGIVKSLYYGKEKILKMSIANTGYYNVSLRNNKNQKTAMVHKLVAICFLNHQPNGYKLVIDHINDNKLDNRVENLQIVTNRFNSHKTQGKYSSKFKGVSWNKFANKWVSTIRINSKKKYLGYFDNELDAHFTYQSELLKLENGGNND